MNQYSFEIYAYGYEIHIGSMTVMQFTWAN